MFTFVIRYNEIFGPGAIVFSLGYTQSLASGICDRESMTPGSLLTYYLFI